MPKLILFDVDQTLVDALPYHRRAFDDMLRRIYGVKASLTDIRFYGMTVPNIIREICRRRGVPEHVVNEKLPIAVETLETNFLAVIEGEHLEPLPGVKMLLRNLRATDSVVGVLTGNPEKITQSILKSATLVDYFDIFVYGSEGESRAELVGVALRKAKALSNLKFSGRDIVIIGDSIHDIDCGTPYNAMTIAVLTGFYTRAELEAHKPDYIFTNLTEPKIFKILVGD